MKTIGHVSSEMHGRDLLLRCNHCGQTECVADYGFGGRPRLFAWREAGRGQLAFAKCHHCLMVYDRSSDEPVEQRGARRVVYR
ncbi:MAG TPA: hypothetical protein VIP05_02785 [Burkholderiaceae bacterium]